MGKVCNGKWSDGVGQVCDGEGKLSDVGKLCDGEGKWSDGVGQVCDGQG